MELTSDQIKTLTKKRWIVLIASCIINLCAGSLYAWSVFATPMAAHLNEISTAAKGLDAGSLAIVFTVANAISPLTLIGGGVINDRIGPKWVIFVGGLLFGGGMILSGFATSVTMLTIAYGIISGLGMGLIYGCTISNSVKFFPDKRGLIGGIATASYGLSSVIVPIIANALISGVGIVKTFCILGAVFLVIICVCALAIVRCPVGFAPHGWVPKTGGNSDVAAVDKNWRGMLSDPIFYVMLVIMLCGATFGLMTISQASNIARLMVGMSGTQAATAVAVLALFNAAGRVGSGFISDKIGRINTLTIMLVLAVGGLGCLYFAGVGDYLLFYIGIAIVGVCFGSFMGVYPGFTADRFGTKNSSVNYGIMFIGFAVAGIIGPMIVTGVYSSAASYQPAFLMAAALAVFGLVLSMIYRVMTRGNSKN